MIRTTPAGFAAVVSLVVLSSMLRVTAEPGLDARRAQILVIAERYAKHEWRATEGNVLHGADPDGVPVDTPDVSYSKNGFRPGEKKNVGIPYQWGGFSSLEEFDRGVAAGKLAGHVPKSRDARMSRHAVGVDCSGLVSLAWELPQKQSTRSLGALCYKLDSPAELLPGDILNSFNGHVVIVKEFVDAAKLRVRSYEAAIPSVTESEHEVSELLKQGYEPLRYKPLDPRFLQEAVTFRDPRRDAERGRFKAAAGSKAQRDASAAVLAMLGPFAGARRGDWIAVHRKRTHSESRGHVEEGTMFRGVSRLDASTVTLHERMEIAGKRLDKIDAERSDETLVTSTIRRVAGEAAARAPVDLKTATIRRGNYALGKASFDAEEIVFAAEVSVWSQPKPITVSVSLKAIRSDAIPLGGFLEAKLTLRIEDSSGIFESETEEWLIDWERGSRSAN